MVSVEMTPNPCGFYVAAGEKIGYNGQMAVTRVTANSTYKFIAEYKVNKV